MKEIPTKGRIEVIKKGITDGNPHLDMLIGDYVDSFFDGLLSYKIDYRSLPKDLSNINVIVKGIEEIEPVKEDFITFVRTIIKSKTYCNSNFFVEFFERLLQFYNDNDIKLYTGNDIISYSFDNYRFFNQDLFISLVAILVESQRFDVLSGILSARLIITSNHRFGTADSVNYIRFREYNYTLNELVNETYPSKRLSVTADYIKKYADRIPFDNLIKADILLFYLSVLYPGDNFLDRIWYPELAVYNQQLQVLPKIISKRYFDSCKCLFGVQTIEEYKKLLLDLNDAIRQLGTGLQGVPNIKEGLLYNTVATVA